MSAPEPIHLAEVGSTNAWALRARDLPDGQWVYADSQTAGRGRRGRAWVSDPGNLYASLLVRPRAGEGPAPEFSFVAALALDTALQMWVARDRLALKWPNDVLLDGVKCAGILLESEGAGVVIGFGVNIAHHPADTERPATSLAAAGIAPFPPRQLLDGLGGAVEHWREIWAQDGFAGIRAAWLARAHGVGQGVTARLGAETLEGRFEDIGADGALHLRLPGGTLREVHAGDVFAMPR